MKSNKWYVAAAVFSILWLVGVILLSSTISVEDEGNGFGPSPLRPLPYLPHLITYPPSTWWWDKVVGAFPAYVTMFFLLWSRIRRPPEEDGARGPAARYDSS